MKDNYFTYIDYYGDYSFSQIKINEVDFLIFSTLAYLPDANIKKGSTIKSLGDIVIPNKDLYIGTMTPNAICLLEKVFNKKRYKNIRVYNLEKKVNGRLQFGAISFRFKNNLIVCFEGTNNSISGWIENFRVVDKFPTETQSYAVDYLTNVVKSSDKNIYVCGHSKGGNNALVSSYLVKDSIFNRIKKIYNFDGPGFRLEEFNSDRFKLVNKKSINYLPEGSMIGILLFNKKYRYLSTNGVAFKKHYPFNWICYGGFFKKDSLSESSVKLKNNLDYQIKNIKVDEYDICVDTLEKFFKDNNIVNTYDLKNIEFNDFIKMFNDIKDIDKTTKDAFLNFIKMVFFGG